jgi:hypothetical protein
MILYQYHILLLYNSSWHDICTYIHTSFDTESRNSLVSQHQHRVQSLAIILPHFRIYLEPVTGKRADGPTVHRYGNLPRHWSHDPGTSTRSRPMTGQHTLEERAFINECHTRHCGPMNTLTPLEARTSIRMVTRYAYNVSCLVTVLDIHRNLASERPCR